jgi:hypothetical protein
MVWNRIPRVLLFLFHGTEFRVVFSSAEGFGTEFREYASIFAGTEFRVVFLSAEGFGTEFRSFLFRGTAGIPLEISICSVYSVFRGIIFLSEISKPIHIQLGIEPRRLFMTALQ